MSLIDLTNLRVNKLLVLRRVDNVGKQPAWLCRCDCGNEHRVLGMHLRASDVVDCGCGTSQRISASRMRHGMTDTPEWTSWKGMLERCNTPTYKKWANYGGRGVTVCPEWTIFEQFYADMGPRPEGMSLDRIDNNQGYSPSNCRWATHKTQANNTRANVHVSIDGVTRTLKQWSEHFGIDYAVVKTRRADGKDGVDLFLASPRRSYKRLISFEGKHMTIGAWAKHLNAPYITVWQRINLTNKNPDGTLKC
jgi:hypothetical protein